MVERLKVAIEKARERRSALATSRDPAMTGTAVGHVAPGPDRAAWAALPEHVLDGPLLRRRRIFNFERHPQFSKPFDILRTRLLKECAQNGWRRIGVASPTKGCGKTMLCANLGFSFARLSEAYALVVDLDLRAPSLAQTLGFKGDASVPDILTGASGAYEKAVWRVGERLAFGFNTHATAAAAEILQHPSADAALTRMLSILSPTIALYDLPPLLVSDDTLGFLDRLDAILLVAAAGSTRADHIEECDRLLAGGTPLLGVVLNKCEDEPSGPQDYDYAAA